MSTATKGAKAPQTKATSNGTAKKVEPKKVEVLKSESTVKDFLNPTAEDRINRANNFAILAKKHQFLKNKSEELDRFLISSDGTKENIHLTNAEGFKFEVSNTQVIEKVVQTISEQLNVFLEKSNREILDFTV